MRVPSLQRIAERGQRLAPGIQFISPQFKTQEFAMLSSTDAFATVAVKSLSSAAGFYENKLGLKRVDEVPNQVLVYQSGNSKMIVYQSQLAGTNKATAVTWVVDDVDGTV